MQPGCTATPSRDAIGRYPRPRPETVLGWLERLDRSQVHPVLGTPCWLWPGGLSGGYGHVTYRAEGRKVDAKLHILVFELPANRTEQGWWQRGIEPYRREGSIEVEFLAGRLRFLKPGQTEIKPNERPPFGCCLVIWR